MTTDNKQQVAVSKPSSQIIAHFPSELEWKMLRELGGAAFKSGLLPSSIKNAEAATIIALKSRELGIPPMVGYAHIFIVNGKPSMSAELIQATARKFLPTLQIKIIQSTNEIAEIEFFRGDRGSIPVKFTFTIEDAKRANLMGKDVWKQYPRDMLFSRCMTTGLRKVCPEALMGISYTPEELGANVDHEGNVIETTSRPVEKSREINECDATPSKISVQWTEEEKKEDSFSSSEDRAPKRDPMLLLWEGRPSGWDKVKILDLSQQKYGLKASELSDDQFEEVLGIVKSGTHEQAMKDLEYVK